MDGHLPDLDWTPDDGGIDDDFGFDIDDGRDLPPPPPDEPERREWGPGEPPDESRMLGLILFGSMLALGLLKLLFFLVGSGWSVALVGAAFVIAHGLFIGLGASWFWPRRYRRG